MYCSVHNMETVLYSYCFSLLPEILISIRPSDEQPAFLNVKGFLSNIPTQNCLLWKSKGNVLLSKAATFIKLNLVFFTLLNSEIYNQLFPIMIGYKGPATPAGDVHSAVQKSGFSEARSGRAFNEGSDSGALPFTCWKNVGIHFPRSWLPNR